LVENSRKLNNKKEKRNLSRQQSNVGGYESKDIIPTKPETKSG
jgi:hypothetical protein